MIDDKQIPDIVCDVDVPRDGEHTYVPEVWLKDLFPSFSTVGLVVFLLSHDLGRVVSGAEMVERCHADDVPLAEMLAELKAGGFLVPDGGAVDGRLRLVHPARLGPLPAM